MRLNPLHPSDNPMYQQLYCFGSGGNTSGGSASDFDDSYNQAMGYTDTVGGPGRSDASGNARQTTAEERAAAPGYDSKVQDAIDRGEDLTTDRAFDIAAAAVGGGRAGQTDAERASISEAEVAAARAGVPSDVFVTSAGGKIVRSGDGTPVTSGRSVEEAAKAAGTDTSSVMNAINAAAGTDFGEGFGTAPGPGTSAQGPQGTAITQAALEPAKVEAARQVTPGLTPEVAQIASGILDQAVPGRVAEGVRADPVMGGSLFMDDIDVFAPEVTSVNAPPSAIDPSRPMVSIRGATPAEQITAEARAAANQLLGPDRTRPTAAEVAAANARFAPTTGMQPTTPEVNAYNQAINEQIAGQLGVDSYSPGSFNAMKEVQDRALAGQFNVAGLPGAEIPGATRAIDFSDIEAADARDQGIMAAVNAAREVELETGVPAQEVAGIIGLSQPGQINYSPAEITAQQGVDAEMSVAMPSAQGPMDNVFQEQPEDYSIYGQQDYLMSDLYVTPEQRAIADAVGQRGPSGSQAFGDLVRADAELGFPQGRGPNVQSLRDAQQKDSVARSVMDLQQAPVQEPLQAATLTEAERMSQQDADARQPMSAAQGPLDTTDFDRSLTEEETFRAAQGPAPTPDPVGDSINRAISDFAGYREGQTRTQTPDGVAVDDFMLTRDLVSKPTEYGAAYSPLEQLRMQEGTRTVPAVNVPDVDVFGMTIPTSIAGRVISDLVTPGSAVDRALQAGATPIYDSQGRIEGAIDKNGVVYDVSPYDFESSEAMQTAYDEQRRRQEAERGDGGDGMTPMPFVGEETLPEEVPEEYKGRDVVKPYQYQARGPLTYAYTGLPSLAPTRLRPTYTARKTFSPLFPVS